MKKKKKMVCCFLTLVSSDSLSCFDVFSPLELLASSPVPWLSLEGGVACSFGEVVGPSAISHCCAVVPHPGLWIGSSPFQLLSLDYLAAFPVSFGNLGGPHGFLGYLVSYFCRCCLWVSDLAILVIPYTLGGLTGVLTTVLLPPFSQKPLSYPHFSTVNFIL